MAKIPELTWRMAEPIALECGCSIWDVEYIKEAGTWFLRVYLDKPDGITIDDCEAVSKALSDKLDETDPIEGSYVLEVSSPGADRVLKKPEHIARFLGSQVEVRLYSPVDGRKSLVGRLAGRSDDGTITLDTPGGPRELMKKDVAQVRLHITI